MVTKNSGDANLAFGLQLATLNARNGAVRSSALCKSCSLAS